MASEDCETEILGRIGLYVISGFIPTVFIFTPEENSNIIIEANYLTIFFRYIISSYLIIGFLFLLQDKYIIGNYSDKKHQKQWQNFVIVCSPFILIEYLVVNLLKCLSGTINRTRKLLIGE